MGAALQWCKCLRDWNCIQGLGLGAWFVTYSFYNNDYKSDTEMFVYLFFLFLWNLLCSRSICHRITKASDSTPHSPSQKDNRMHAQLHLLKIYSSYGSEWLEHVGQNYLESSPGEKSLCADLQVLCRKMEGCRTNHLQTVTLSFTTIFSLIFIRKKFLKSSCDSLNGITHGYKCIERDTEKD